jgi:hypothetical protein
MGLWPGAVNPVRSSEQAKLSSLSTFTATAAGKGQAILYPAAYYAKVRAPIYLSFAWHTLPFANRRCMRHWAPVTTTGW